MRFDSTPEDLVNREKEKTMNVKLTRYKLPKELLLVAVAMLCLSIAAPAQNSPCAGNSGSRQLDYWLGHWSISSPGSADSASSRVTLDLDKCVVVENWDGGRGHVGENIFGYNPESKSWMGFFADNRGHIHVFDHGRVSEGSAEFEGPSLNENGEAVLNRIRIVQLAPGKVEQTWDKSTDKGVTWKSQFRLEYTRKAS